TIGDQLELGRYARDGRALYLVGVLVEEAEPEDPEGVAVGLELLDDQVVVLAGLDVAAVLANGLAGGLLRIRFEGLDGIEGFAADFQGEFHEGVTGAGSR